MKPWFAFLLFVLSLPSYSQNVGIGTTTPAAKLHTHDGDFLVSSSTNWVNPAADPPADGYGSRMMWYRDKAAFRVGGVWANEWTKDSIGLYSVAMGLNPVALGNYSAAIGQRARAYGTSSIALGLDCKAESSGSVVVGYESRAVGVLSFVAGYRSVATGSYSVVIGPESSSSGLSAIAIGAQVTASGGNSIAMGAVSNATENFSVAIGRYANATNFSAVSLGEKNTASGGFAFATGLLTKASGTYAATFGGATFAKAVGGFTIGIFNDSTDAPDAGVPQPTDRIFQVGNGSDDANRRNALTIQRNSSAVFIAHNTSSILPITPADPPVSGTGIRMMWYADKAAFRAGAAGMNEWDNTNTGGYSFAGGYSSIASGNASTAFGANTTASGITSFAAGNFAYAIGDGSAAIGFSIFARAKGAATFGIYNDNTDAPSATTEAPSDRVFQIGIGSGNLSRNNAVTVLRNSNVGIGTLTPVTRLDVAGYNNWDLSSTEGDFRIGNSSYRIKMGIALAGGGAGAATIRSAGGIERLSLGANNQNLLTLNGATSSVGIGTETPSQKLHVIGNILASGTITPSDARFKKDIQNINSPLEKIMQLNGVTYHYRADEFPSKGFDSNIQVGVIAQEVEKVFPQLVFTDKEGYKAVDYPKLLPLLIEGIKAQQQQIEELKILVKQLSKN